MVETTRPGHRRRRLIQTGTGNAIVMGGTGDDTIDDRRTSTNFVFGDDGYITWVGSRAATRRPCPWAGANADPTNIDLVVSTDPTDGGNDTITIGSGQAIVVGGAGDDTITGGSGTNVILGDNGDIAGGAGNPNPFGDAADHGRAWSRRPRRARSTAATTRSRSAPAARS